MLQFIVALNDPDNQTGIQLSISISKVFARIKSFDKIIVDRLRMKGYMFDFLGLRIMIAQSYYDMLDTDVKDVDQNFDRPVIHDIFENKFE